MRHILVGTFAAIILGPLGLGAQSALRTDLAFAVATVQQKDSPVTIDVTALPLSDVLRAISKQSGIAINYSPAIIPANRTISIRFVEASAEEAVRAALKGTGIGVQRIADGSLLLSPAKGEGQQEDGIITGRVLDAKTKRPIAGATITLDNSDTRVVTGDNGSFRIDAAFGSHRIHVRYVGYGRVSKDVMVESDKTVTVEIVLEANANVLNEVVVTGTVVATARKAIATPITVITAEDIEKRGITRVDQLMRGEIPGLIAIERGTSVYANDDPGALASSKIYSRGSTSLTGDANPIKTYVDGVEILDPSHLGTIDPASIERIEIITGPQAATIYGSGAMGGVMQIFTKRGHTASADITLNVKYGILENTFSDGKTPAHDHSLLLQGGNGPVLSYSANLFHGYTGQWQPMLFARRYGGSIGATHVRGILTVGGSISITGGRNGTHTSNGLRHLDGLPSSLVRTSLQGDGTLGVLARDHSPFHQQISTSSSQILALNLDYRPLSFWQTHLVVGKTTNTFALNPMAPQFYDPIDSLFQARESAGQRTTINFNTTAQSQWNHLSSTLTIGGNGSWGSRNATEGCLANASATEYVGCRLTSAPKVTKTLDDQSWGGFGSVQLGLFGRGFLTAALRGERNPSYGDDYGIDWTPTVGGTFVVEVDQLTIKTLASYGSATRPPRADQRERVYGFSAITEPSSYIRIFEAPLLGPEYSRGPQVGVEIYYGNLGSFTLNHYVQRVDDLIQAILVDSFPLIYTEWNIHSMFRQYQFQNSANMRQEGWSGQASLTLGPISLKGTYSWDESRITSARPQVFASGGGYHQVGDAFRGVPTHTGNIVVGYAHRGTSLTWITNYIGSSLHYTGLFVADMIDNTMARHQMYRLNMEIDDSGTSVSPGYTKSNLVISHRVSKVASFTMNITNVFNSVASDVSDLFPSLGRQTLFGLSLRL